MSGTADAGSFEPSELGLQLLAAGRQEAPSDRTWEKAMTGAGVVTAAVNATLPATGAVAPKPPAISAEPPQHESLPAESPAKPPQPPDTLSTELALVDHARALLRNGQPAGALTVLDRCRKSYPRSNLDPEATQIRVKALRALGRRDEAKALADSPQSRRLLNQP